MKKNSTLLLFMLCIFGLCAAGESISCAETPQITGVEGNSSLDEARYFKNGIIISGAHFGTLPKVEIIDRKTQNVIELKVILAEDIATRIEAIFPENLPQGNYDIRVTNQDVAKMVTAEDYNVLQGETGPMGPSGPQGVSGPAGPSGPAGSEGTFPGTLVASVDISTYSCSGSGSWQKNFSVPSDARYAIVSASGGSGAQGQSCGLSGVLISGMSIYCRDTGNVNQAVSFTMAWGSCYGNYLSGYSTGISGRINYYK